MARVTRRPLAAADILEIWNHIAEDSLDQADRWVDGLDEGFRLIATQPLMGRARHELAADLRSFPFWSVRRLLRTGRWRHRCRASGAQRTRRRRGLPRGAVGAVPSGLKLPFSLVGRPEAAGRNANRTRRIR